MNRSATLSLGLVVAAGLAAWVAWPSRSGSPSVDGAETASRPTMAVRGGAVPQLAQLAGWTELSERERESGQRAGGGVGPPPPLPRVAGAGGADRPPAMAAVWNEYQPTREEMEFRAQRAEQQAAHELGSLLRVLDLDEEQQDRVFAALVRRAEYFHPALQVQRADGSLIAPRPDAATAAAGSAAVGPSEAAGSGGAGASLSGAIVGADPVGADPVMAELTPALADVYERYTSERDAFWVGIVEDIEAQLNTP